MYQIYFDGQLLYDPRLEELAIREPSVHLAVSEAGSVSFLLDPDHPRYGKITPRKGVLELLSGGETIYRGRVLKASYDFYNSMVVESEGLLACLNDSVIPPFQFPDDFLEDGGYQAAAESGNVVEFFLGWLLDTHNSQVTEAQQIKLGRVTVTDPNNYITRSCESYANTWETVKGKLFGSTLGGYFLVRYEADGTYVDYVASLPDSNPQPVEFGSNLLDLTDDVDTTDTYTDILPVGTDGLTIAELEDGPIDGDLVKSGVVIYSKSAREKYGEVIVKPVTWNEVTQPEHLRTKAADWLANQGIMLTETITASAVDLGLTSEEVSEFRVGRKTLVQSPPHSLSETYPLTEMDLELLEPENTRITLGESQLTLSARQRNERLDIESRLDFQTGKIVEIQTRLDEVSEETRTLSTEITQTCESIVLEAMENYALKTDLEDVEVSLSAKIQITAQDISSEVERASTAEGELSTRITQTAEDISAEITRAKNAEETLQTSITANAEGIKTKVSAGDIISTINQSAEAVTINASKVNLTGYVTVASLGADGTTTIDGSRITTGTLDATKVALAKEDYGGFGCREGSTGSETTYGAMVYGSAGSSGNYYAFVSNKGVSIRANSAYVNLWGDAVHLLAKGGAYVTLDNPGTARFCPKNAWINLGADNAYSSTGGACCWQSAYFASSPSVVSDRRLKTGISYELDSRYDALYANLKPASYQYVDGTSGRTHTGFVAQDVEEALEAAGLTTQEFAGVVRGQESVDGEYSYFLRYEEFVALNTYQIQRLMASVTSLEERMSNLEQNA